MSEKGQQDDDTYQGEAKQLGSIETAFGNSPSTLTDRLSNLAPEILGMIWDQVRASSQDQMIGAICHALLPYTRQNLYGNVVVETLRQFELLRRTVEEDCGDVAPLIRTLEVKLDCEKAHKLSPESVEKFFKALTKVSKLKLQGCEATPVFICILASPPKDFLKELQSLDLSDVFLGRGDPLHYRLYTNLNHYPSIKRLSIHISYPRHDIPYDPVADPEDGGKMSPNRTITYLSISGETEESGCTAGCFLKYFRVLEALDFFPISNTHFGDVFKGASSTLMTLRVGQNRYINANHLRQDYSIDKVLLQFPNLSILHLGANTFFAEVYDVLVQCHSLRKLTFEENALFTLDGLKQILLGSERMRSLEEIGLFIPCGSIGESSTDATAALGADWKAPQWHEGFTYPDAIYLEELQGTIGVKITEGHQVSGSIR